MIEITDNILIGRKMGKFRLQTTLLRTQTLITFFFEWSVWHIYSLLVMTTSTVLISGQWNKIAQNLQSPPQSDYMLDLLSANGFCYFKAQKVISTHLPKK